MGTRRTVNSALRDRSSLRDGRSAAFAERFPRSPDRPAGYRRGSLGLLARVGVALLAVAAGACAADPVEVLHSADTQPPRLEMLSPAPGDLLIGSREIVIHAVDESGPPEVDIVVGGIVVETLTGPPYRFMFDPATWGFTDGRLEVSAVARDGWGNASVTGAEVNLNIVSGFGIRGLMPAQGGPGTLVTVHGNGFDATAAVALGGVPMAVTRRTSTTMAVEVPRDVAPGDRDLSVRRGSAVASGRFRVLAPRRTQPVASRLPIGAGPALAVKLREGSQVYERNGVVISDGIEDTAGLSRTFEVAGVARVLGARPEHRLQWKARQAALEMVTGEDVIDPTGILEVRLRPGIDPQRAADIIATHPLVEVVHSLARFFETPAGDLPPAGDCQLAVIPDHLAGSNYSVAAQLHDTSRRGGLGILAAWAMKPSTRGLHATLVHAEYGWEIEHEDLPVLQFLNSPAESQPREWVAHGTAVAGLLVAEQDMNDQRTVGVAPEATLLLYDRGAESDRRDGCSMLAQIATSVPTGSVILITMQLSRKDPADSTTLLRTPWEDPAIEPTLAECIRAWTLAGYVIVEAAGNGGLNLDTYAYQANAVDVYPFAPDAQESGAIIVGAAEKWQHARYSSESSPGVGSNFGTRVDLHGWGERVVTSGGCDLAWVNGGVSQCAQSQPLSDVFDVSTCDAEGLDLRQGYTGTFSGTSAAATQVAGTIAALQSFALGETVNPYLGSPSCQDPASCSTAARLRDRLSNLGTPQKAPAAPAVLESVGPMPDLGRAVCDAVEGDLCLAGSETCTVPGFLGSGTRELRWQNCQCAAVGACCPPDGAVCQPNGLTCWDGSKVDLCWDGCSCDAACSACPNEPPSCNVGDLCGYFSCCKSIGHGESFECLGSYERQWQLIGGVCRCVNTMICHEY